MSIQDEQQRASTDGRPGSHRGRSGQTLVEYLFLLLLLVVVLIFATNALGENVENSLNDSARRVDEATE